MREATVTLAGMAADLRENRVADLREQRQALVKSLKAEYDDLDAVPTGHKQRYEKLNQRIESAKQAASSLEYYAGECEGDGEFVLQELNMDQFAATVDETNKVKNQQRRDDDNLPAGMMMVESLKRGVVECPDYFDADPGAWPAVVGRNVHDELEQLGVGATEGNEPSFEAEWETI